MQSIDEGRLEAQQRVDTQRQSQAVTAELDWLGQVAKLMQPLPAASSLGGRGHF